MGEQSPDMLQAFLAGRDVACPGCGYNLRDLPGKQCPECGEALTLYVGMIRQNKASVLTGLIGLTGWAMLNALVLALFLMIRFAYPGSSSPDMALIALASVGLVVSALAIVFWVRRWETLRGLPPDVRGNWEAACWLLPLAFLILPVLGFNYRRRKS